ncbi:MAG TPA: serine hydrolase domain-containing protein [Streptosporangiaceae bacterium]|jgi:CubicO group peptidase (beta-lactamase class C family)
MSDLQNLLEKFADQGTLPGAVGLVARGDHTEVAVAGSVAIGGVPMAEDSIFRLASITKPITAAAVMLLVQDGRIKLDDPVARWLPELAEPKVVRTPASAVDDVVPATRPITVFDLLSSQAGYGFASDSRSRRSSSCSRSRRTAVRWPASRRRTPG